jgi:O-antigen ligase
MMAFAALLSLAGWLVRKINFSVNPKLLRRILIISLIVLGICALVYVYFSSAESGFIYELNQVMHGNFADEFGSNRIRIWKRCIEMFKEYPLLGSGPDTAVGRYNIIFERFSPIWQQLIRTGVDSAHNEFLNLLVNVGIIGLVPFIVAICAVLFKKKKDLNTLCAVAVLGYVLQSMFLFSITITAPYFWLFLGLADKMPIKRKIRINETTSE